MHFNLTLTWKYITHHIAQILAGGNFDVLQLDIENLSYQNFQRLQVHGEIQ